MKHPLVEILRTRDANLAARAEHLIAQALPILPYTASTFPTGTSHGSDHTTTVEQIGRMLLSDQLIAALTDHDLFFLALSCHYHDLALAGTVADDATPESRDQVRRDHALRIGAIIKEKMGRTWVRDPSEAETLGEICRGHRPRRGADGRASWDELARIDVIGVGKSVRLRLLSSCIYATDELHIGADRAPKRTQAWRDIQDEESKRHWQRHQAIEGPAPATQNCLCFKVRIMTPGFEKDVRKNVLLKALNAVQDFRHQLIGEDITAPIPDILIQWDSQPLWRLLLPASVADLCARSEGEIEAVVWDSYVEQSAPKTGLDGLCKEVGATEEEMRAGIRRAVGDAIRQAELKSGTSGVDRFTLAVDERIATELFDRMSKADDLDRLFVGHYNAHWKERFFGSGYGRAFVTDSVVPAVASAYSVNLATHPFSSSVRGVLESTPTAMRIVMDNRPLPSNLVRLRLLELAALTGATFDLFANPDLVLDRERRHAYRELAHTVASKIQETVRFLEELALVGGLSPEQVASIQIPSDAARKALGWNDVEDQPGVTVSVKQTIPKATIGTSSMLHVVLAAQRAGVSVQLMAAPEHSLEVDASAFRDRIPGVSKVSFLEIGPALAASITFISFQARLAVDPVARTLRIYLKRFDRQREAQWPLRVQFGSPETDGNGSHFFSLSISIRWPFVAIDDLAAILSACQVGKTGEGQAQVLEDASGKLISSQSLSAVTPILERLVPEWATQAMVEGLVTLGGASPVPLFFDRGCSTPSLIHLRGRSTNRRNRSRERRCQSPPSSWDLPTRMTTCWTRSSWALSSGA